MKKILALLLVALMTVSMVACGDETTPADSTQTQPIEESTNDHAGSDSVQENDVLTVGDTASSELFEITLTSAEFSDKIKSSTAKDDFMRPLAEDDSTSKFASAPDDEIYLCYSFEYKFIGKGNQNFNDHFTPTITYNDEYNFSEDWVVVRYSDYKENWFIIGKNGSYPLDNVLGRVTAYSEYKALDSTVYEARGVIRVPKELAENTDASLTISFPDNCKFVIR